MGSMASIVCSDLPLTYPRQRCDSCSSLYTGLCCHVHVQSICGLSSTFSFHFLLLSLSLSLSFSSLSCFYSLSHPLSSPFSLSTPPSLLSSPSSNRNTAGPGAGMRQRVRQGLRCRRSSCSHKPPHSPRLLSPSRHRPVLHEHGDPPSPSGGAQRLRPRGLRRFSIAAASELRASHF